MAGVGGAPPFNVSVSDTAVPPMTVGLLSAELTKDAGSIVRAAVFVEPEIVAVIVAAVDVATPKVVTVKLAVVPEIATVAGTVAADAADEARSTTAPETASADRVSDPETLLPPITELEPSAKLLMVGAFTTTPMVLVTEPSLAITSTVPPDVTGWLVAVKAALDLPGGTNTLAGVVIAGLDALNAIVFPEGPAGPERLTVTVAAAGGLNEVVEEEIETKAAVNTSTVAERRTGAYVWVAVIVTFVLASTGFVGSVRIVPPTPTGNEELAGALIVWGSLEL